MFRLNAPQLKTMAPTGPPNGKSQNRYCCSSTARVDAYGIFGMYIFQACQRTRRQLPSFCLSVTTRARVSVCLCLCKMCCVLDDSALLRPRHFRLANRSHSADLVTPSPSCWRQLTPIPLSVIFHLSLLIRPRQHSRLAQ